MIIQGANTFELITARLTFLLSFGASLLVVRFLFRYMKVIQDFTETIRFISYFLLCYIFNITHMPPLSYTFYYYWAISLSEPPPNSSLANAGNL